MKLLAVAIVLVGLLSPFSTDEGPATLGTPKTPEEVPHEEAVVEIAFVGDIMLDRYIRFVSLTHGYEPVLREMEETLGEKDLVVGNLEGPVTTFPSVSVNSKIDTPESYSFTFSSEALSLLRENNISAVSIGNNHILNFGSEGLSQTRDFLKESGISHFGDPLSKDNTSTVLVGEELVSFVPYNEFLNPDSQKAIRDIALAATSDFVVVYAHWGKEYEKNPSKEEVALAHSFIDAGADLVIGSHPHVIQSKEIYKNKAIYYSLGNFVFDQYFSDDVKCGAMVTAKLLGNGLYKVEEQFVSMESNGITRPSSCEEKVPLRKS